MKIRWFGILVILFCICWGSPSYGNNGFGMVFDLSGDVEIQSPDKPLFKLIKNKHLLYRVKEGDKISVAKNGSLLIVAFSDSKGFVLGPNTTAIVKNNEIKASKGMVTIKEGYHAPLDIPGAKSKNASYNPIGAVIMRGSNKPCVRLLSPVNTLILDLTPNFRWENECKSVRKYSIKILKDSKEIATFESNEKSFQVPVDIIKYGNSYDWLIKEDFRNSIAGSRFILPTENEANELKDMIGQYRKQANSMPERLSFIFFLNDNYLYEMAAQEIITLKNDFPENEYIGEMN